MVFNLQRPATRLIILLIWLLISVCSPALAQTSQAKDPIDEILSRFARPNMPGCAASVVLNGSVVVSRAFGLADVENHTEITPDTRFDLASMSKQFVAMAVLKVASEGKLSLTEDVHRYVPELPSYKWKVTLLDLLHHTSGLKDYVELLYLAGWRYGDIESSHDVLWALQSQKDLAFEPGTRYSYANANYFLLGLILER